ncbi:hypothetical protein [Leifsonia shinshuensis]|uniref:DUF4190 domain-containing protein n=1 Tax=Leifsonia shinshuensis TaxID=150026 RepID=A0A853CSI6_9MICO|nr:hypothetical protein [Leifsonia shinshuensis]
MTDATDDRIQPAPDGLPPLPAPSPEYGEFAPAPDGQAPTAAAAPAGESVPAPQPFTQAERVGRGLALALLIIPAGVIAWTVLWNIGFIASIVSWGVAIGAVRLYRFGSKARVTRGAFWGIIAIVAVTLVLSLLAGIYSDLISTLKIPLGDALTDSRVWSLFADNLFTNGDLWQAYLPTVGLALLFAVLGCFTTLRRVSQESRA